MTIRTAFLIGILILFHLKSAAQSATTTLQYESLGGSASMQWAVQRFEMEHLLTNRTSYSVGIETQSAILGNYGGFYVFGTTGSISQNFGLIQLRFGGTLGAGGGAGAPDGDGLMWRLYGGAGLSLSQQLQALVTLNRLDFPSGAIRSDHLAVALHYRMPFEWGGNRPEVPLFHFYTAPLFGVYDIGPGDASGNRLGASAYAGILFGQYLNPWLSGELQLSAAGFGPIDGYMNYSMGLGARWPQRTRTNAGLFARTHLGSGGGGGALTGGGLAHHLQVGAFLGPMHVGIGQWTAFEGGNKMPFVEASWRLPLTSNFALVHLGLDQRVPAQTLHPLQIGVLAGWRQGRAAGVDKNGAPYLPMSGLFFGGLIPIEFQNWQLLLAGETLWAASGGYGAYAEGMFGLYADVPLRERWFVGVNSSATIAGGGGIDVGNGLGVAGGGHMAWQWTPNTMVRAVVRKKTFGAESYSPWLIGLQFEHYLTVLTER